jgi:hypothetical protein
VSLDEVVGDAHTGNADRRAAAPATHQPGDTGLAHQPPHPLARDPDIVCEAQLGVDAPPPVDAAVLGVDRLDLLKQPGVGQLTVRRRATLPLIERRTAHAQ